MDESKNTSQVEETEEIKIEQNDFDPFLSSFIKAVEKKKLQEISTAMLYFGNEENRNYIDTYHLGNSTDKQIVTATIDVLNQWITRSDNFALGLTSDHVDQWGKWRVQEIVIMNEMDVERRYLSFLNKEGKWYLVRIDNSNPFV